jgi:hypothetical protein
MILSFAADDRYHKQNWHVVMLAGSSGVKSANKRKRLQKQNCHTSTGELHDINANLRGTITLHTFGTGVL